MFDIVPANVMIIVSTVIALGMGVLVTTLRAKSAKRPASVKKSYYRLYLCQPEH